MALNLKTLIDDYNGGVLLSPGHAEWGYVDQSWYIQLPEGCNKEMLVKSEYGTSSFGNNLSEHNFVKANYQSLMAILNNQDKALFGAMMRYHFVARGILTTSLSERAVLEDEFSTRKPLGNDWDHKDNDIPNIANYQSICKFVKRHGDTICHMLSYAFCARGHHWQPEFNELYERLLRACFILKPSTWTFMSNEELFRLCLHGFGIRRPFEYTAVCLRTGNMINPMKLRFSPHAPVAGAAQITTSSAILREMKTEPWWPSFQEKFEEQITEIESEVTRISEAPYTFHVASMVLLGRPKNDITPSAHASFIRISQCLLGYLDHLGRRHPLTQQKVITSRSGGIKATAESFARACDRFGKPDHNVVDMRAFLALI